MATRIQFMPGRSGLNKHHRPHRLNEDEFLLNDYLVAQRRARKLHELGFGIGQAKWDVPPMGRRQDHCSRQRAHSRAYERYLNSPEWRALRAQTIKERGGKCERCTSESNLHVHHRSYARLGRERPRDLEVLCRDCHDKEHLKDSPTDWRSFRPADVELAPARQIPPEEYLAKKS